MEDSVRNSAGDSAGDSVESSSGHSAEGSLESSSNFERQLEEIILRETENLGIHEYAFIRPEQVEFSAEVRRLCEKNACGMYGKSWACPPGVGSIEDCRSQCLKFAKAFVFTSMGNLKSRYDMKEWLELRVVHEKITDQVAKIFRTEFEKVLVLSTEGCTVCKTCTYPDQACRFPDRMYPATEGYGILVTQLAKTCNIKYNNGVNSLTYFSVVFFKQDSS